MAETMEGVTFPRDIPRHTTKGTGPGCGLTINGEFIPQRSQWTPEDEDGDLNRCLCHPSGLHCCCSETADVCCDCGQVFGDEEDPPYCEMPRDGEARTVVFQQGGQDG